MTTAAIADGVVAVDTQVTGGTYAVQAAKLVRVWDGGVAVAAGAFRAGYAGLKWLAEGERGDPPDIEGATIAIVRPDGVIWLADDGWPAFPLMERSYAIGCGQDLVRMAMANGADPVQAVAQACELDINSSAPILSMAVCPTHEYPAATVHEVRHAKRKRTR